MEKCERKSTEFETRLKSYNDTIEKTLEQMKSTGDSGEQKYMLMSMNIKTLYEVLDDKNYGGIHEAELLNLAADRLKEIMETMIKNEIGFYDEDFEKEAARFLEEFGLKDALSQPQPIPIRNIITEHMGLKVVETEALSEDNSVFGAISFEHDVVPVYVYDKRDWIGYETEGPTIFVDADIQNEKRINMILAHECYHWWRQRLYFIFANNYFDNRVTMCCCEEAEPENVDPSDREQRELNKLEHKANMMARAILMPMEAVKTKIHELHSLNKKNETDDDSLEEVADVVSGVADFFQVTKKEAAYRLMEVCYTDAGRLCGTKLLEEKPVVKKKKKSEAVQHFQPITEAEADELYGADKEFQKVVDRGGFTYVDGYYVPRDGNYITNGHLTTWARDNLKTIALDITRTHVVVDNMAGGAYLQFVNTGSCRVDRNYYLPKLSEHLRSEHSEFNSKHNAEKIVAQKTSEFLGKIMDAKKITSENLLYESGLQTKTYYRLMNDKNDASIETLVMVGIALSLDTDQVNELLSLNGHSFIKGNKLHDAYRFLFSGLNYRKQDFVENYRRVDYCNDFLRGLGLETLRVVDEKTCSIRRNGYRIHSKKW